MNSGWERVGSGIKPVLADVPGPVFPAMRAAGWRGEIICHHAGGKGDPVPLLSGLLNNFAISLQDVDRKVMGERGIWFAREPGRGVRRRFWQQGKTGKVNAAIALAAV